MVRISSYFSKTALQVTVIFIFLSLRLLLDRNMSGSVWNEVDVLPLAKQFVDRDWIANDWYLNLETNYRYLFQIIFGWLIVHWGFLATSIIGRICCYGLIATGLVLLGQQLGLNLTYLLLATIALTYQGYLQGVIAGEWFVGGLEAKAVAYGLLFVAIPLMLSRSYLKTMLLLGLATSFHVLVGGWAFLTTLGWLCLRPQARILKLGRNIWWLLGTYITASSFAIPATWQELTTANPSGEISPSFIYVFLRLPHHLNPFAWHPLLWLRLAIYIGIWIWCANILIQQADLKSWQPTDYARVELSEFTLVSLIPFVIGMAIALFDTEGKWLQYYPFRFGDVMLPLTTYLLTACTLQSKFTLKKHRSVALVLIGCILFVQITFFGQNAIASQNFPTQQQDVDPQWKLMSDWIKNNTPQDAIFMSHPWYLANFTWMTQRATVVKLKMLPQSKDAIVEYYQRLNDLSSGNLAKIYFGNEKLDQVKTVKSISAGFSSLNTSQVTELMNKYQCEYFLSDRQHHLELPVVRTQSSYVLYQKPGA